MNRAKLLLSIVLSLATACADNRSSIAIAGRAAPSDDISCRFAAGGQDQMGPGILDVAYAELTYRMVVYVSNELDDPTVVNPQAIKSSKTWRAESAKVRVNPADYVGRSSFSPALLAYSGENVVPLDGQDVPIAGSSVQWIEAVSHPLGLQIAAAASSLPPGESRQVVLGITLQGETLDGAKLDSAEWFYPVDVCNGCLPPPTVVVDGVRVLACQPSEWVPTNCYSFGQDSPPACP